MTVLNCVNDVFIYAKHLTDMNVFINEYPHEFSLNEVITLSKDKTNCVSLQKAMLLWGCLKNANFSKFINPQPNPFIQSRKEDSSNSSSSLLKEYNILSYTTILTTPTPPIPVIMFLSEKHPVLLFEINYHTGFRELYAGSLICQNGKILESYCSSEDLLWNQNYDFILNNNY